METFDLSKQTWANVMDLKELLDVNCMESLTEDLNRKMDDVIPEAKHCSRCRWAHVCLSTLVNTLLQVTH